MFDRYGLVLCGVVPEIARSVGLRIV
jgi:hypothetical protein